MKITKNHLIKVLVEGMGEIDPGRRVQIVASYSASKIRSKSWDVMCRVFKRKGNRLKPGVVSSILWSKRTHTVDSKHEKAIKV